jgi:serine/threonine protein kinase/Tfp pilus assembly protein PilF
MDEERSQPDPVPAGRPRANADPSAPAGTVVGPYTLLEPIGEGGFGTVYLAEQAEPVRRRVALKLLKPGMDSAQVVRRFEAERHALALMEHPCIAKVLDAGTTDEGRPFFVMEYVDGVPITTYCDEQGLSTGQRLRLFQDVCRGVQHAHQKGVVHRDIKPSNVLVTRVDRRPTPKIIDFGIAKALEQPLTAGTAMTELRQILGTPEYMSPEQASGLADVDTRADVYSLGVLLYELLTGSKPFDLTTLLGRGIEEVLRHIREVEPPRPSVRVSTMAGSFDEQAARRRATPTSLRRAYRGDLDWIVLKALEKDRERRYPAAIELAEDVDRYLAHEPVLAGPPSALYRFRKFARRNRALLAAGVVIAVSLVGAVAALGWSLRRVSEERDAAELAQDREAAARLEAEAALAEAERLRVQEGEARATAEAALAETEQARAELADALTQAQLSLEESEAVTEFLSDMLGAVDPGQDGQGVTVRELLDRSAGELGPYFAEQPRVELRLRRTIGDAYRKLGLYDDAEQHLPRALEVARATVDRDDERLQRSLIRLAQLRDDQGRLEESEALILEALELARASDPDSAVVAGMVAMLAWAQSRQGREEEAERNFRAALPLLLEAYGPEHQLVLSCQNNLQNLLWKQGRFAEAAPIVVELAEVRERVLGSEHPDTLLSRHNRTLLWEREGRMAEAEQELRAVLDARRRVLGPDHPHTLDSLQALGISMRRQGRYDEAVLILVEAVEASVRVLGEQHPQTATCLRHLGLALWQGGRPDEAEAPLERAVAASSATLGAVHPDTLEARNVLAIVEYAQGHLEEAVVAWEELYETQRAVLGEDDYGTVLSRMNLAMVYSDLGRFADAEAFYVDALDQMRAMRGPEDGTTQDLLNNLGTFYIKSGRFADAREPLLEVIDIRTRLLGPGHPLTLGSRANLGVALLELGRLDEAEELFVEVIEGTRGAVGPDHPDVAQQLNNLGLVLWDREDLVSAAEVFEQAIEVYLESSDPGHVSVLDSRHNLGCVLHELGELERAEALLAATLEGRRAALGPDATGTLESLRALASVLVDAGRPDEARPLLEELLLRRRALAAADSATPIELAPLARLLLECELTDLRDPAEALVLARRAVERSDGVVPDHLITLARAQRAGGDEAGALETARRAHALLPEARRAEVSPEGLLRD